MSSPGPDDVPCSEALARMYSYLDDEIETAAGYTRIRQHLDECGPCLREYGLEEAVKRLVQKCCGSDDVPDGLRTRVLSRIQTVRIELEVTEFRAE
jgi:mycothiol system anti-sigma-R factor